MKREDLEKYIGKRVEITLFNDKKILGTLKRGDAFNPNAPKWYHVPEEHFTIRCSHVKKIRQVWLQ